MDAGEAFGPGAAQKFGQNGFSLIVAGMSGGHGINFARCQKLPEPCVSQTARSLFNRLA